MPSIFDSPATSVLSPAEQPAPVKPVKMRDFTDVPTTRQAIYDNVLKAFNDIGPLANSRHTLTISDPQYVDPDYHSLADQKDAILKGKSLYRRVKGTWTLTDNVTGKPLDQKSITLAQVPFLTNRGTFILSGTEYSLCLHGSVKVWTEQGMITIKEIVDNRLSIKVWSWDFASEQFVLRPIIGWYRNPVRDGMGCAVFKKMARMNGTYPQFTTRTLWATPGHDIYDRAGHKYPISEAKELTVVEETFSYTQEQLLYGTLLGDGHVRPDGLYSCSHGKAQTHYAELKHQILSPITEKKLQEFTRKSGFGIGLRGVQFCTRAHPAFHRARRLTYVGRRKTICQEWLDKIDEMGLAFWFGDDGHAHYITGNNCVVVHLATCACSAAEISLLRTWLRSRWEFETFLTRNHRLYADRDCGWQIGLSGSNAERFLDLIAAYLSPDLHYKLLARPKTSVCACGNEIKRTRKYCNACLLQQAAITGVNSHDVLTGRFGSTAIVKQLVAEKKIPTETIGVERWQARIGKAGSAIAAMRADTKLTYKLTTTPCQYLENRQRRCEQARHAYDIQVEGTHNYIANGVLVSNSNQARLRPGAFVRVKENGEIEAHINVMPGGGMSHRYFLDPETGVFKINIGQAKLPLYPVLKALGITDAELRKQWGNEIAAANLQADNPQVIDKLYSRLIRRPMGPTTETPNKAQALAEFLNSVKLDPEVTTRTLGKPYSSLTKDAIIDTTRKLLAVSKQQAEPDDRDHMAYQTLYGPEDLLPERITRDKAYLRQLLWKASFKGNLESIQPGALSRQLQSTILHSGLGQASEEVNNAELLDAMVRATRLGEGGIGSIDAVPSSARAVQPSHLSYVDILKTPESFRVGVDARLSYITRKGDDGRLYAPFIDVKTGEMNYYSPQQIADMTFAFPGEMRSNEPYVAAMVKGKTRYVPRETVQLEMPHMEHAFSPLSNMIPYKSAVKGQRTSMGARFLAQALPLIQREAPLVQSGLPHYPGDPPAIQRGQSEKSFEDIFGTFMGAVKAKKPGVVRKVTANDITVQNEDGTKETYELYNNFPYARKTFAHNEPMVKVGDKIGADQLLAKSNYTDDKGTVALGLNAKIVMLAPFGKAFEDALVISESFAKKLTSEHMYQHEQDWAENIRRGKKSFVPLFPTEYTRPQLDNLDNDGIVKPGTVVKYGDPLVLVAQEKERTHSQIHRGRTPAYSNKSILWEHHAPGFITDVAHTPKTTLVAVKAVTPMQVGDKLCFDELTEVLTNTGWKAVADVTMDDEVCALTGEDIVYQKPVATYSYPTGGKMYRIKSQQVDQLVTENHRMYVKLRNKQEYNLLPTKDIFGKRVQYKKNGNWNGLTKGTFELPGYIVKTGQGGKTTKLIPPKVISYDTYMLLLGCYLSEGSSFSGASGHGIDIHQVKPHGIAAFDTVVRPKLEKEGFRCSSWSNRRCRIQSRHLYEHFKQFGHCDTKYIPNEVFSADKNLLRILFDWLMWGDGHSEKYPITYSTTSKMLADDVQRLCLHIGKAANIVAFPASRRFVVQQFCNCKPYYHVQIINTKLTPEVNHGHTRRQKAQEEQWIQDYDRPVYCVEVPSHVIYVRRNGLPVWSGNSQRYGGKGVVSQIVPDDQMPHDENGEAFEIAANPLGAISRINIAGNNELVLAKIAKKRGLPYKLEDFGEIDNLSKFVSDEAKKYGVSEKELITDPATGRKIKAATGYQYFLKLHHTSEAKGQGRSIGGYTQEFTPAKAGPASSKLVSLLESNSLLSHGATEFIRDAHLIRGQKNDAYWQAFMSGLRPPEPVVPFVYRKFVENLKAAGINVVREGGNLHLMALTDKDIDTLAGNRAIKNTELVDWKEGLKPKAGGLFDTALTGGHAGSRWAYIPLHEPLLNPAFEEPTRHLLDLTQQELEDVIAGKQQIETGTGTKAIKQALANIDVDKAMAQARLDIQGTKRGARDDAIRKLQYLKSAKRLNIHPSSWVLSKVPVIPPSFRPVSIMQGTGNPLVSDANYLYKELFDANENLKQLEGRIEDLSQERMTLYNAFKGITGLGDPVHPKNVERRVRGILKHIFADSPKFGTVQRQLIATPVDIVGRAVITPNPDLDLDQVGIPESKAWDVYKPFIIRNLVRKGVPRLEAVRAVNDRLPMGRKALLEAMEDRPVVISRAPVLHRYGIMAFWPKLIPGDVMQTSPTVIKGFGGDYDGNCVVFDTEIVIDIALSKLYHKPRRKSNKETRQNTMTSDYLSDEKFFSYFEEMMLLGEVEVLVQHADGLLVRMPIGKFPRIGEPQKDRNGADVYPVPEGVRICTYDHCTGEVRYDPITQFTVDKNHPCVRVTTARSKAVEVSDNESLCVFDYISGGLKKAKPAESIGRLIPVIKREPITGTNYDKDIGWWYGSLVSDGWVSERMVGYAKTEAAKRHEFTRIARSKVCENFIVREYGENGTNSAYKLGDSVKVHMNGRDLAESVLPCVDEHPTSERAALYKRIPTELLSHGSRDTLIGILSGLIDGDGTLGWNTSLAKPRLCAKLSTSSKGLVKDVAVLCRKLGVKVGVTTAPPRGFSRESYAVLFSANDIKQLLPEMKLIGEREQRIRNELSKLPPYRMASTDIVPITIGLADALAAVARAAKKKTLYTTLRKAANLGHIGRSSALACIELVADSLDHPQFKEFSSITKNDDIHWEIIETVEPIEAQDVFDFEVPSTKVFAIANGLVVYDTMNYHVPVSEEAKAEAIEKLLPSKNLFSVADFGVHYLPQQEYQGGLYMASTHKDQKRRPQVFRSAKDAIKAYKEGEVDINTPVEIVKH